MRIALSEMSRSRVACSRNVPITMVAKPHISVTTCGPVCGSCAGAHEIERRYPSTINLKKIHKGGLAL